MRGFIWDIPILIFAYVLLLGPMKNPLEPQAPYTLKPNPQTRKPLNPPHRKNTQIPKPLKVEARKLEQYPHALKLKYKGILALILLNPCSNFLGSL